MTSANIEWIFFDWGGTLAQVVTQDQRFRSGVQRVVELIAGAKRRQHEAELSELILKAEERAAEDPELREADIYRYLREWCATLGPTDEKTFQAAVTTLGEAWIGSLEAFDGVREALRILRDRGHRLGVVSNCMVPPPYPLRECERLGLAQYMDFLVFSSEVGYRKPSPHIYRQALNRAFGSNVPSDLSRVLFVGDSPAFDVMVPATMGMKTALVKCHKGIWPAGDYERARPDLQIDSVAELPALLG